MKRLLLALGCALGLGACADPPLVLQGTVERFDVAPKVLVVRDELPPNAVVELSVAEAEIGADPVAGDLVRVAYRVQDGAAHASRVMNLTRQADLAKPH